jgi:hypothetical protein
MLTNAQATAAGILAAWLSLAGPAPCPASPPGDAPAEPPFVYRSWQTYTTRDGLPHDKVLAVRVAGAAVWVGTAGGLARLEQDAWTVWTEHEGLPWPAISAIDIDTRTRDVWLGTWGGGLIRFSGGRFDEFNQLNSGLAGNMVFAVAVAGDRVWVATHTGLSSLNTADNTWDLHFERRADGPESVVTGLSPSGGHLYATTWCGPVWKLDLEQGTWSQVSKPAGNTMAGRGSSPIRPDTTSGVAVAERSLWRVTQEALSRRDRTGQWEVRALLGPSAPEGFVNCLAVHG